MKKKIFKMLVLLVICFSFAFSELPEELKKGKKQINKTMTEQYGKIALNNLEMWFSNNGINCENPTIPDNSYGFMFPKGSDKRVVYRDGPVLSGMVNNSIKFNCCMYLTDLQPGQSIQGVDPADPRYRIYMIRKDWQTLKDDEVFMSGPDYTKSNYARDYNEWPIDMGAPYELDGNGNKVPKFIGDEQAWYVMNDLNTERYSHFYRFSPLGTEWQTLVWAYDLPEALGNVIFKKYTIINKGTDNIENAYLSYWSDIDVGEGFNNYAGSDTILNLGYAYSSSDDDYFYGATSPAVGYAYLQGPTIRSNNLNDIANWNFNKKHGYKNLDMTSFNASIFGSSSFTGEFLDYTHPALSIGDDTLRALSYYNLIQGYGKNGNPRINTLTEEPSKFMFSGDPITKTGWIWENGIYGWVDTNGSPRALYPGWPIDVNITISSGPFTLAVGDTQEVVIGIVVGQGADRLSSITVMKNYTLMAQKTYNESIVSQQIITVNEPKEIPSNYSLSQNYPNPFNPSTIIQYTIPKDEFVKLKVYDITGKVVKELVNGHKTAGKYTVDFNASNYSSGTYYYKLEAGEYKNIQKMMLVK